MQPFVTIFTLAYNAENCIRETIESVLRQDETNWEYVIRDNGSTDNTYVVIQEYAQKDSRIRVVRNKINHCNDDGSRLLLESYCPNPQGEYIAHLDSDDLLKEDFVSKLYACGKENQADIVIAGTQMFLDKTKKIVSTRVPAAFVFRAGDCMTVQDFIDTYGSLRTLWGKLYRTEFYMNHVVEVQAEREILSMENGIDTLFSLAYLSHAKCVVSIPEFYHYYRIKEQGLYRSKNPEKERIDEGKALFWQANRILPTLKLNTDEVINFLYCVYLWHINDLVMMMHVSEKEEQEAFYSFFEKILNDDLLEIVMEAAHENWYNLIEKPLLHLLKTESLVYDMDANHFLQNLSVYFAKEESVPRSIRFLYLLLGVFHRENQYYYGLQYLIKEQGGQYPWINEMENKSLLSRRALVNTEVLLAEWIQTRTSDSNSLKLQLLEKYDEGNLEEAFSLTWQILENNPLDVEGLYFGIILSYTLQKQELLIILLDLQRTFYPLHGELIELVKQI